MAHALIVEGSDPITREQIEDRFEPLGHEMRAEVDEEYKRATWGRRPEDVQQVAAFMTDVAGGAR